MPVRGTHKPHKQHKPGQPMKTLLQNQPMPNKFPNKPPLRRHKEIHELLTSQRCWVAATMKRAPGSNLQGRGTGASARASEPTD